jgi:hypothetical protein
LRVRDSGLDVAADADIALILAITVAIDSLTSGDWNADARLTRARAR